jgi:ABC-2 type transport system ATP-binding protein
MSDSAAVTPDTYPASASRPALQLTGVSKRWGASVILDGVDLAVPPGTRAWIGGRNGAGKTTLLRIAAGLIAADSGKVALHGLDPVRDRRDFQSKLGFLSAGNTGLYARLTAWDNLDFWAGIAFVPRRERRAVIESTVERFSLHDLAGRRVDRLSMGQRQRVRLAMTFLHSPAVVMLDEPQTSLDDDALALLGGALDDHARGGGTALLCAPTREKLELVVDSAYVVEDGRLVPA